MPHRILDHVVGQHHHARPGVRHARVVHHPRGPAGHGGRVPRPGRGPVRALRGGLRRPRRPGRRGAGRHPGATRSPRVAAVVNRGPGVGVVHPDSGARPGAGTSITPVPSHRRHHARHHRGIAGVRLGWAGVPSVAAVAGSGLVGVVGVARVAGVGAGGGQQRPGNPGRLRRAGDDLHVGAGVYPHRIWPGIICQRRLGPWVVRVAGVAPGPGGSTISVQNAVAR